MAERCDLCKERAESVNHHILIHCERTKRLWMLYIYIYIYIYMYMYVSIYNDNFGLKWVFLVLLRNLLLE